MDEAERVAASSKEYGAVLGDSARPPRTSDDVSGPEDCSFALGDSTACGESCPLEACLDAFGEAARPLAALTTESPKDARICSPECVMGEDGASGYFENLPHSSNVRRGSVCTVSESDALNPKSQRLSAREGDGTQEDGFSPDMKEERRQLLLRIKQLEAENASLRAQSELLLQGRRDATEKDKGSPPLPREDASADCVFAGAEERSSATAQGQQRQSEEAASGESPPAISRTLAAECATPGRSPLPSRRPPPPSSLRRAPPLPPKKASQPTTPRAAALDARSRALRRWGGVFAAEELSSLRRCCCAAHLLLGGECGNSLSPQRAEPCVAAPQEHVQWLLELEAKLKRAFDGVEERDGEAPEEGPSEAAAKSREFLEEIRAELGESGAPWRPATCAVAVGGVVVSRPAGNFSAPLTAAAAAAYLSSVFHLNDQGSAAEALARDERLLEWFGPSESRSSRKKPLGEDGRGEASAVPNSPHLACARKTLLLSAGAAKSLEASTSFLPPALRKSLSAPV